MSPSLSAAFAGAAWLVATAAGAAAQEVRGRVVDEINRQAVASASVVLADTVGEHIASTLTDANGFFVLRAPAPGDYRITVTRVGFAEQGRNVTVGAATLTVPAFVLDTEAVRLDPVDAAAARRTTAPPTGFARASYVVAGARMARLEAQSARLLTVVRDFSGLRFREWRDRSGREFLCVESIHRVMGMQPPDPAACRWPVLVIDGAIMAGDPQRDFRTLRVAELESIEYMHPAEAGQRYGMDASANGALVMWTRGRGPHVSDDRNR